MPPGTLKKGRTLVSGARASVTVSPQEKAAQVRQSKSFTEKVIKGTLTREDWIELSRKIWEIKSMDTKPIVKEFGQKALTIMPDGFQLTRKLGEGDFGVTYQACLTSYDCVAVKFLKRHLPKKDYTHEADLQRVFAEKGLAPRIYRGPVFYSSNGKEFVGLVMERIDGTLDSLLEQAFEPDARADLVAAVLSLLGLMEHFNLTHGDLHTGNIGYRYATTHKNVLTLQLILIDFGYSVQGVSNRKLDALQLLRTLREPKSTFDKDNVKALIPPLVAILKDEGVTKTSTYQDLEDQYFDERRRFRREQGLSLDD